MSYRLNKVLREFGLGINAVAELLCKNGMPLQDASPNAKISNEQYRLILSSIGLNETALYAQLEKVSEQDRERELLEENKVKKLIEEDRMRLLLEEKREIIRQQLISDGYEDVFNIDDNYLLDAIIEDPKFYDLKKNTIFIDLHGYYLNEALDIVKNNSFDIIHGDGLLCCGFIHGRGLHSTNNYLYDNIDNIEDFYELDELYDKVLAPTLKPLIRKFLDILAKKSNNCKNIYGEKLFKVDSSRSNSGITYFMNMDYYNFFNELKIKWTSEKIWAFQEYDINKSDYTDDFDDDYADDIYNDWW